MSQETGCSEYQSLSRRKFLVRSAQVTALAATLPAWVPKVAFADSGPARDVLISVYLRGGCDGLTLVAPYADDHYYTHRPNLAVPRPDSNSQYKATDLDGFFGLPPTMLPLLPIYQAGELVVVHACGLEEATRSHFDAQRFPEVGKANASRLATGWLGRHLASIQPMRADALIRGVGVDFGMPKVLQGGPRTLPIPDPSWFTLWGDWQSYEDRKRYIDGTYRAQTDPIRTSAINTLQTMQVLSNIDFDHYQPAGGAQYPDTGFGKSMQSAAALIRADIGVEAIHVDIHGWDTHSEQGSVDGQLRDLMADLSGGLRAIHQDLNGANRRDWTLIAMSEFGRNAIENGSRGTDHGFGNCMFAMGAQIAGGQVIRNWPGLHEDQLVAGMDLGITIDYRDVIAEIVDKRLGNGQGLAQVFPGFVPQYRGVVRA